MRHYRPQGADYTAILGTGLKGNEKVNGGKDKRSTWYPAKKKCATAKGEGLVLAGSGRYCIP